ncbi:MAG TPA: adenylate/guanylate cyclase domain-containing protein [Methylophilaceae bacterium]|nr:adenylate/guanylate cyclase domain-containing protein [Methylophilaceae bacterium]
MLFIHSSRLQHTFSYVCIVVLGLIFTHTDTAAVFNHLVLDHAFEFNRKYHPQPIIKDPVIVGIDEEFLETIDEPLSLSHSYISQFLSAVSQARPAVIGIDLGLPEKRFDTVVSTKAPDLSFHQLLALNLYKATHQTTIVAAKVWNHNASKFQDIELDYAAILGQQIIKIAHASALFCPDKDGVIRAYPGKECQPGSTNDTFTRSIASATGLNGSWGGLINYQVGASFSYIPIQNVINLSEKGEIGKLKQLFAGKIVLIGTVLKDEDLLNLPVSIATWMSDSKKIPGVTAHAQVLRSMLSNSFINPVNKSALMLLTIMFGLFWFGRSIVIKTVLLTFTIIALIGSCVYLLRYNIWLPPGNLILTAAIAFSVRAIWIAWVTYIDKKRLTLTFGGYVSPEVMKEIVSGNLVASQTGKRFQGCVLFSDIRGFTTLSEHLKAEDVVDILNRYFARMTKIVHKYGGTVDKFIGDGLMAFFGAPNKLDFPEENALEAAKEMLLAVNNLNIELLRDGLPSISIGIGLHSGEAVVGHIGSSDRHEYTAIGDTVNTSARLEGLCKDTGCSIICSEVFVKAVDFPDCLVSIGEYPLKGRSSIFIYGYPTNT